MMSFLFEITLKGLINRMFSRNLSLCILKLISLIAYEIRTSGRALPTWQKYHPGSSLFIFNSTSCGHPAPTATWHCDLLCRKQWSRAEKTIWLGLVMVGWNASYHAPCNKHHLAGVHISGSHLFRVSNKGEWVVLAWLMPLTVAQCLIYCVLFSSNSSTLFWQHIRTV
jgi:hypothetical protein